MTAIRSLRLGIVLWVLALQGIALSQNKFPPNFDWDSGDALAFIGDETTYDGRWCQYVENYFFTRYPDRRMVFYNAGNKNDTARDVLDRIDEDVIDRKINIALIMLGTWDAEFKDVSPRSFAKYQTDMRELIEKLRKKRVHPILVSPPMFDYYVHQDRLANDESYRFRIKEVTPYYNGVMGYYTSWLRVEAVLEGLRFADAWGALNAATQQERRVNPEFSLMADAVLPDAGGHAVIAAEVIKSLAPGRDDLGSIQLEYRGSEKGWESRTEGGSLSQLSGSTTQLSFIWKARALPWAFPLDATIGVELAEIDERFNKETLAIVGLEEGDYELLIAGEKVGESFSARELAFGLPVHQLADRPQYQRAQAVAKKNAERYATAIVPLREHWQQIKRVRQNFPTDLEKLTEAIAEREPKMNALRNQSRELSQEIYEAAKPLGRNFEIRKIEEEEKKR